MRSSGQGPVTRRVSARLDEVASVGQGAYGRHAVAMGTRALIGQAAIPQQRRSYSGTPVAMTPNLDRARVTLAALPPLPPVPAQTR